MNLRPHPRRVGGILTRREGWTLAPVGWLVAMVLAVTAMLVGHRTVYPFLAVTERAVGQVLVVEGWAPTEVVSQVAAEFGKGSYRHVVVVEGVRGTEAEREKICAKGERIARLLVHYRVPQKIIRVIEYPVGERDRTYHGALAVRRWLAEQAFAVGALDVATTGAHARRSRLLYERAFGQGVRIGVIALRGGAYDPARWWRSSEGIREVPFEAVAYLYVRLLFSAPG